MTWVLVLRNIILISTTGSPQWTHSVRIRNVKPVHTSPFPHYCYMPGPYNLLNFITRNILGTEYRPFGSSLCNFLSSPLPRPSWAQNNSPQHPILKHPQPTFLPQCQRPSFTPIQNDGQKLDATVTIYWSSNQLNMFREIFCPSSGAQDCDLHLMV
jgi:hypothetical protein